MRLTPVLFLILALSACSHSDNNDHSIAHEAGKAAYKVSQASEKAAKKAGQELKQATKEAHEGWKDAKHEDKAKQADK